MLVIIVLEIFFTLGKRQELHWRRQNKKQNIDCVVKEVICVLCDPYPSSASSLLTLLFSKLCFLYVSPISKLSQRENNLLVYTKTKLCFHQFTINLNWSFGTILQYKISLWEIIIIKPHPSFHHSTWSADQSFRSLCGMLARPEEQMILDMF